jgi:hypothetical protein
MDELPVRERLTAEEADRDRAAWLRRGEQAIDRRTRRLEAHRRWLRPAE